MRQPSADFDRWYVRLLAAWFAIIGGVCSLRYLWVDVTGNEYVALPTQLACFTLTAASIVFFVYPKFGHHVLFSLTIIVLLLHGPAGPAQANLFWILVAILLVLPWLFRHRRHEALGENSP